MSGKRTRRRSSSGDRGPDAGTIIGQYRVERVIATRPGVDTVLEAHDPAGSRVAVTVLGEHVTGDPERLRATLQLVRVRASLKHPHLLSVRGPRRGDGKAFYVTAQPSAATLAERLRSGPLPPSDALRLARQVASALELAASKGLVHHDLTPAAIGLKRGGPAHALLGDFALTSPYAPGCDLLAASGNVRYRSPEELRGRPAQVRSNVYSLACIMVECLTGAPPYAHDPPLLTMQAHLGEAPPKVTERNPRLPAELDAVIARSLAKDPAERYRSPSDLVDAAVTTFAGAAAAVKRAEAAAPPKTAPKQRARPPQRTATRRRRRITAWAAGALAVSAISGFATGSADWSGPSATPSPAPELAAPDPALAAHAEYVREVHGTVRQLGERRAALRKRLRQARRPVRQAATARRLAVAYRRARRALPPAPAEAVAAEKLAPALRAAEGAYRDLAAAARSGDKSAWNAAGTDAVHSEAGLQRALERLAARQATLERSASQRSAA